MFLIPLVLITTVSHSTFEDRLNAAGDVVTDKATHPANSTFNLKPSRGCQMTHTPRKHVPCTSYITHHPSCMYFFIFITCRWSA